LTGDIPAFMSVLEINAAQLTQRQDTGSLSKRERSVSLPSADHI
jgi:hypothetical protein